ncbi:hypothetical protein ACIQOV_22440 [Kitasatospora sp. NPDC091257]|uniref:hypothetical protein n=1 Tax=Kitasatospora sp. NPDC091257 TaxID=3364084 RepID=UPI003820FBEB
MSGTEAASVRQRLGHWWRLATTAPGGPAARKLTNRAQGALDAVASGRRISTVLRTEVRSAHAMLPVFNFSVFASALVALAVFGLEVKVVKRTHVIEQLLALQSTIFAMLAASILYSMYFVAARVAVWCAHEAAKALTGSKWNHYRTLEPLLEALAACESPDRVGDLPRLLRGSERAVRRARLRRGTVPRRSHRQAALKEHAGKVVAALRTAEASLDTYPELARCDLAAKLHSIAEAYVEGRLGALLPESDLEGVKPSTEFETLRLAVLAVTPPALAWTAESVGLTGGVQVQTVGAGVLISAVVLFGRRAADKVQQIRSLNKDGP